MKNTTYLQPLSAPLLLMAMLLSGCIKENLDACDTTFRLTVKAFADGVELDRETIKEVSIYVFDENELFVELINAQIGEDIRVNHQEVTHFTIVAVGNGKQGGQSMPNLAVGDHLTTALIGINQTRSAMPIYACPDDVFLGLVEHIANQRSNTPRGIIVPIHRLMASINITIKGLKGSSQTDLAGYSIVMRKSHSHFDFYGRTSGQEIAHPPLGSFNTAGIYFVPNFNLLPIPNSKGVLLDIHHHGTLLTTVVADSQGNPINPQAGELLNLLIDFAGDINVSVVITPWGKAHVWKEWN